VGDAGSVCSGMRRAVVVVAWLVLLAGATLGCGSRCAEIAARKSALLARTEAAPGPHAQMRVPLARANQLIAALIHDQPLRTAVALPSLGPWTLPIRELTATARRVELRAAARDRVRFAIELELADAQQVITPLTVEVEVTPALVRSEDSAELVAGFGPDSLVSVVPALGPDAGRALTDAVARWLPPAVRDHLPHALLDRAAAQLASYLTREAYQLLRTTLLRRLGELTRLRVRLPALPIATSAITSTPDAMTIDLTTDLPVRRGLAIAAPPASDDVTVRISASTAAELANWSIAHGQLPQHYTRDLAPRADGAYRPIFDYVAADARRPAKLHIFQERGGCSYFQVGLRFQIAIVHDQLVVEALDRLVEVARASTPLELGLWLKQLIQGPVDRSYRAAAHTELTIGDRKLVTRVVGAVMIGDDLELALQLAPQPATRPARTAARAAASSARAAPRAPRPAGRSHRRAERTGDRHSRRRGRAARPASRRGARAR